MYLSGRVNAAVFYDLSIANLLLPSRKNLEIGLGLVNVLTLGELKAVLAHEFGHFAQKSMAVGRWVYIAQQIAGHIVARRDALDAFLTRLSRFDLRIAWIGWLLRLIVWSIRSLIDLLFRVVVIAQRALSREMEFQADLVAVSVTGSDALIHALHKLGAADSAWDRTLSFAASELQEKRGVRDLFAIQLRVIENLRSLFGDETYGSAPPVPTAKPEAHRVFKVALAAPPRMWATHPANSDREANAKRHYVRADIDDRSAWTLFNDPQALRDRVSAHMARASDFTPVATEVSLTKLDEQYARGFFNPRYRGAYLGRSIVRHAKRVEELYGLAPPPERLVRELDRLYPESLSEEIERLRTLEEERQMLVALREGFLTAPGGVIRHRGTEMSRKALPAAIEEAKREVDACAEIVRDHDRRCRTAHLAAARTLGEDWASYLKGLLELLHYADHVEANLLDAHGLLSHTVAVATADGKVSSGELERILHAADLAYVALKDVHEAVERVIPDRTVLNRMKVESWSAALEKLALPPPDRNNIGDWLNAITSWIRSAGSSLASLRLAALEQLLAAESQVAVFTRKGMKPAAAPPASVVPRDYRLLTPGSERPRDAKLSWWDRFQTASGVLPTIARFATAAAIIGAVLLYASGVGSSTVHVFNGLERSVVARINGAQATVAPGGHAAVDVGQAKHLHIVTTTTEGQKIEEFDMDTAGGSSEEVYNVAGAAALVSWSAAYGNASAPPKRFLGPARWTTTDADIIFKEPPVSISTKGRSGLRRVLTGIGDDIPGRVLGLVPDDAARSAVIATHARWDASDSREILQWFGYASRLPDSERLLSERLREQPHEPLFLRLEQDAAVGKAHDAVCERHRKMAAEAPEEANLQYAATRCIRNSVERDRAFVSLHERWPENGWFMLAAAYVLAGEARWQDSLDLMTRANEKLPAMRQSLIVESARIQRVLAGDGRADLSELERRSEYLRLVLAPEHGEGHVPESQRAYFALAQGDFKKALQSSREPATPDAARILRLVAASDGASTDIVERALALPPTAGLDLDTLLPTLSLAALHGRDTSAIVAAAPTLIPRDADTLLAAFAAIRKHASRRQIEKMVRGLAPAMRGHIYVAAAMVGADEGRREWRTAARQLLFTHERPFLR